MSATPNDDSVEKEPKVEIFWFFNRMLIIDTTPVSQGEAYGDHVGHSASHLDYWAELQRKRLVPPEVEYEEHPRGRVGYDKLEERYWLRADRCILRNPKLVSRILKQLHLPSDTKIETDYHYQCAQCLSRRRRDE
jgi:hypothetical protein